MDCHCFFDSCINVVGYCCLLKVFLDWEYSAWDLEDGCVSEEGWEFLGVHGGWGDDDLDISSFLGHFLEDAEQNIGIQASLVGFVHDDGAVHLQFIVIQAFSQQDTVGHVFDDCLVWGAILETDGVSNYASQFVVHLLRHSFCHWNCCHSSGLCAADDSVFSIAILK